MIVKDDEVRGYIEVYVDQTASRAMLGQAARSAFLKVLAVVALTLFLPIGAFFWLSRRDAESRSALAHAADHDSLTGLPNRRAFRARLDSRIADAAKKGRAAEVHFIDLDKFKDINDTRGHAIGDDVLREVAARLREIVGPGDNVCRLGGDEFAVARNDGPESAVAFADRIIAAISAPVRIPDEEVAVGASVGVSRWPKDGATSLDLLKAADLALYAAKGRGRGRCAIYEPAMETQRAERVAAEQRLRRAIDEDDFELAFQPLFETHGMALCGFEALLRLPDLDGSTPPILPLIRVAEETRLINPLGALILERACRIAADWDLDLFVTVNLSPIQFESGDIAAIVADVLRRTGLAAERLELEVTESILMRDPDSVAYQLDQLKELGVSIALDDFGTGYSSLSYLWRFPFDKLKIDRSFVGNLGEGDARTRKVLETVVALGDVLRLKVIAEGVENAAQDREIRQMKIDYVQGFHYGRPTSVAAVRKMIAGIVARGPDAAARSIPQREAG